jgi:hypothetical protein
MESKTIEIFGIKYRNDKPNLKISRDNYAIIDKKNHFQKTDKYLLSRGYHFKDSNRYDDPDCAYYSDEYCIQHQKECLYNYDLNMNFFAHLDQDKFNKTVDKIINRFKNIKEINNLNDVQGVSGVYVLVLQEYKQLYIGESKDIYKRIKQHWNRKMPFDRLIFGRADDSVISVDSFGPLDTKRILIYESKYDRQEIEEKIVRYVPDDFIINRTRGGTRGFDASTMWIDTLANRNKRSMN